MAFTEVADLGCETAYPLGGKDKKTGKSNPTKIEGYFIGSRDVASKKSKTGFAKLHIFQTPKGNIGIWGKTDLDSKLRSVTPGVMVRASFVGMVETQNNPMYKYKVEVDNENTIDVASVQEAGTDEGNYEETDASTAGSYEDGGDVNDSLEAGEEEAALDETPPARTKAPTAKAQAPSLDRQAKVKALLNGGGARKTA